MSYVVLGKKHSGRAGWLYIGTSENTDNEMDAIAEVFESNTDTYDHIWVLDGPGNIYQVTAAQ